MNLIKLFIIAMLLCASSISMQAQQVKPKFKKILYTDFYLNKSDKNHTLNLINYLEIDENGKARFKLKNNPGILDTTYQLNDTLIVRLNKVFNGDIKLKSFMVKDKYPEGTYYMGSLHFIKFVDYKNLTHNFIVVPPFMDQNFNELLEDILFRPSDKAYQDQIFQDKTLESQIVKCLNTSQYALDAVGQTPLLIKIDKPN
jgi:hypothetical protein